MEPNDCKEQRRSDAESSLDSMHDSIYITRSEQQGSGSYIGSFQVHISQGCVMPHTVSHQRLSAEARILSQVQPCRIFGGRKGTGTFVSQSTSVSPVEITPVILHTHSFVTDTT